MSFASLKFNYLISVLYRSLVTVISRAMRLTDGSAVCFCERLGQRTGWVLNARTRKGLVAAGALNRLKK